MSGPRAHGFAALLKYWRARRGLSQLDLSAIAEVSTRHISYLETGRSRPSKEMVWQLCHVLDVPIRQRNELLTAAGFHPAYAESTAIEALEGPLRSIVATILRSNEPFPTMVLDRRYVILAGNDATTRVFSALGVKSPVGVNLMRSLFRPEAVSVIVNWEDVAADALRRLHREVLSSPHDAALGDLFEELRRHESISGDWWSEGFDQANEPALPLAIRGVDGSTLTFLATSTTFNAPRNAALDDLVIETWYPADE